MPALASREPMIGQPVLPGPHSSTLFDVRFDALHNARANPANWRPPQESPTERYSAG